jgi:hypothetical protein
MTSGDFRSGIPQVYKKKENLSFSKKLFSVLGFPLLGILFFFGVFFFWKWFFVGVGIAPDQIRASLGSVHLSERRGAILEWAKLVRTQSPNAPQVTQAEVEALLKSLGENKSDYEFSAALAWVMASGSDKIQVEKNLCALVESYGTDASADFMEVILTPMAAFVSQFPCLSIVKSLGASANADLRRAAVSVLGAGFEKGKLTEDSEYFMGFLKDQEPSVRWTAALSAILTTERKNTEPSLVQILEQKKREFPLNPIDKKLFFRTFDQLSRLEMGSRISYSQELEALLLEIAETHKDLQIRSEAKKWKDKYLKTNR